MQDEKKEKALEKEKRKEERERKKAEKMVATKKDTRLKKIPTVKSTNEKTRKGKGKATVKDTRDLDTCLICMQSFQEVGYDMGDWIECHCKQWIHENCTIMYLLNLLYVQNVYNSVMNL